MRTCPDCKRRVQAPPRSSRYVLSTHGPGPKGELVCPGAMILKQPKRAAMEGK